MSHQNEGVGSATVLLAFVAGAAVGAAVALLFAPAAGTETRAYVNRRAREARSQVEDREEHGQGTQDERDGIAIELGRGLREDGLQPTGPRAQAFVVEQPPGEHAQRVVQKEVARGEEEQRGNGGGFDEQRDPRGPGGGGGGAGGRW